MTCSVVAASLASMVADWVSGEGVMIAILWCWFAVRTWRWLGGPTGNMQTELGG